MKTKLLIGIIGFHLFLFGCSKVFITEISKSPYVDINLDSTKTVVIIGMDNVIVSGFKDTYGKLYQKNIDFVNDYTNLLAASLNDENIFYRVKSDHSPQWSLLKSSNKSKGNADIVDSLFKNCNADYVINIDNFEIYKTTTTCTGMYTSNGYMATGNSVYCIINSRVMVFDTKSQKIVLAYTCKGEGGLLFFAYEACVNDAINNSVKHTIKYLKTGKTKF